MDPSRENSISVLEPDRDGAGAVPPETLEEVRRLAEADDRSVSSLIRRAVEHEPEQQVG